MQKLISQVKSTTTRVININTTLLILVMLLKKNMVAIKISSTTLVPRCRLKMNFMSTFGLLAVRIIMQLIHPILV
nr:MAG TPA: hypothetical protein [Bacteriophage sp.]